MSGEYGGYHNGYMHTQAYGLVDDFRESDIPGAESLAKIMHSLARIATGICWYKACDSGIDYPISEIVRELPELERNVASLKEDYRVWQRVVDEAIREHVNKSQATVQTENL